MPDREFDKVIAKVGESIVKGGRRLTFSLGFCNQLVESFARMKAAGNLPPFVFSHDDADPRNEAGDVVGLAVRNGELVARVSVIDGPDAEKIGKTIRKTSPRIEFNAVDGKGNRYPAAMMHLAMVSRPVIPNQSNFQPVSLSFNLSLDEGAAMWGQYKKGEDGNMSLSMTPEGETGLGELLKKHGVADKVELSQDLKGFMCSLGMPDSDEDAEGNPKPAPKADEPPVRQQPNMLLSLDEMSPREKRGVELSREGIRRELKGLMEDGRVKPEYARRLFAKLDKPDFLLSLANEDTGATDVEQAIEVIKANSEAGQFLSGKRRTGPGAIDLGMNREEPPADDNGDMTPAQMKAEINKRAGRPANAPVALLPGV